MPEHVLGVVRDITDAKARETEMLNEIAMLREQLRGLGGSAQPTNQSAGAPAGTTEAAMTPAGRDLGRGPPPGSALGAMPSARLSSRALQAAHGQRNRAAQLMGISRSRLYRRMEALGVDLKDHP